jgi:hypothetical protein
MNAFARQSLIAGEKVTDVTPNGKPGPHKQGQSDQEEALVTQLIDEMRAAWRQGQRPLAEVFLHRHPELCSRPQAGVRLIYEEICLRQEYGLEVASVEVVNLARRTKVPAGLPWRSPADHGPARLPQRG